MHLKVQIFTLDAVDAPHSQGAGHTVPLIRIFGTTSDGKKCLVYVHGCFPYFLLDIQDIPASHVRPQAVLQSIASSLTRALERQAGARVRQRTSAATASGGPVPDATSATAAAELHARATIHSVSLVHRFSLYGYRRTPQMFAQVRLNKAGAIRGTARLARAGACSGWHLQPYEAHIPFSLQFLIDFSLVGMGWVDIADASSTPPPHVRLTEHGTPAAVASRGQPAPALLSHILKVGQQVDREYWVHASQILNPVQRAAEVAKAEQLAARSSLSPGRAGLEPAGFWLVSPIQGLWRQERMRCLALGIAPPVPPPVQLLTPPCAASTPRLPGTKRVRGEAVTSEAASAPHALASWQSPVAAASPAPAELVLYGAAPVYEGDDRTVPSSTALSLGELARAHAFSWSQRSPARPARGRGTAGGSGMAGSGLRGAVRIGHAYQAALAALVRADWDACSLASSSVGLLPSTAPVSATTSPQSSIRHAGLPSPGPLPLLARAPTRRSLLSPRADAAQRGRHLAALTQAGMRPCSDVMSSAAAAAAPSGAETAAAAAAMISAELVRASPAGLQDLLSDTDSTASHSSGYSSADTLDLLLAGADANVQEVALHFSQHSDTGSAAVGHSASSQAAAAAAHREAVQLQATLEEWRDIHATLSDASSRASSCSSATELCASAAAVACSLPSTASLPDLGSPIASDESPELLDMAAGTSSITPVARALDSPSHLQATAAAGDAVACTPITRTAAVLPDTRSPWRDSVVVPDSVSQAKSVPTTRSHTSRRIPMIEARGGSPASGTAACEALPLMLCPSVLPPTASELSQYLASTDVLACDVAYSVPKHATGAPITVNGEPRRPGDLRASRWPSLGPEQPRSLSISWPGQPAPVASGLKASAAAGSPGAGLLLVPSQAPPSASAIQARAAAASSRDISMDAVLDANTGKLIRPADLGAGTRADVHLTSAPLGARSHASSQLSTQSDAALEPDTLTVVTMEMFAAGRNGKLPDPEQDAVLAMAVLLWDMRWARQASFRRRMSGKTGARALAVPVKLVLVVDPALATAEVLAAKPSAAWRAVECMAAALVGRVSRDGQADWAGVNAAGAVRAPQLFGASAAPDAAVPPGLGGVVGQHAGAVAQAGSAVWRLPNEAGLLAAFVALVRAADAEVLMSWDTEIQGMGYVRDRCAALGTPLARLLARGRMGMALPYNGSDTWAAQSIPAVPGRVLLNVWRIVRSEAKLANYDLDACAWAVLQRRLPVVQHATLLRWWGQDDPPAATQVPGTVSKAPWRRQRGRVLVYLQRIALAVFDMVTVLDVLGRTAEMSRLIGLDFHSTMTRGSQFRVEAVMLRLAKPLHFTLPTAYRDQVARQPAMEVIPLVMEPRSSFYTCPVAVLDFQSLYPSVMIAYNMCFSTCLGKLSLAHGLAQGDAADAAAPPMTTFDARMAAAAAQHQAAQSEVMAEMLATPSTSGPQTTAASMQTRSSERLASANAASPARESQPVPGSQPGPGTPARPGCKLPHHPGRLGFMEYQPPRGALATCSVDMFVSPNGTMFVPASTRRGVLPAMLSEILDTRVMVKDAAKHASVKSDAWMSRVMHARQFALKLVANVTYGYTAAGFSGRMPCAELADAIVQTARSTLERAMQMVDTHPKWRARVVYGDTDSLFVAFPGRSPQQAWDLAAEIARAVTDANPPPVKLKLEKVYLGSTLVSKKRYAGAALDARDQLVPRLDVKGLEAVRRDSCPIVAKAMERALATLCATRDLSAVRSQLEAQWRAMMQGRWPLDEYVFCKEVRLGSYSVRGPPPPAALVAAKDVAADPRALPRSAERVPYVVVAGPSQARLIDLVVHPRHVLKLPYGPRKHAQGPVGQLPSWLSSTQGYGHYRGSSAVAAPPRLNARYYITRAMIPALDRVIRLAGGDVAAWFAAMHQAAPHPQLAPAAPTTGGVPDPMAALAEWGVVATGPSAALGTGARSRPAAHSTLADFLQSRACWLCGVIGAGVLCAACVGRQDALALGAAGAYQDLTRRIAALRTLCTHCQGADAAGDTGECQSLSCEVRVATAAATWAEASARELLSRLAQTA